MKKLFFSVLVFLCLFALPSALFAKRKTVSLSVSALCSFSEVGYDYKVSAPYRDEQLTVCDSMKKAESIGFSVSLGYFVLPNLELVGAAGTISKELSGIAGLDLPNYYYYNDIAHAEVAANRDTSQTTLTFGLNYHPLPGQSFSPYIGTGGSYILAKVKLLNDFDYTDLYTNYYLWGVWVGADRLGLTIQNPTFEQVNLDKLGFYINGGVNINVGTNIAFYLEGKYIFAKAIITHPLSILFSKPETIEINLGGAVLNLGLKLFF